VRVAARLARALDAPWHAVLVRTPALDEEAARRAHAHLGLAESLGATVATVASDEVAAALVGYARTHNLHTLVLGSSGGRWWQRTLVDAVSRAAHDLELHIVPGQEPTTTRQRPALPGFWPTARDTAVAGGFVGLATAVGWLLRHLLPESDLLMLYLLVVVVASFRLPRAASLLTALGAVAAFNFFFIEPIFTFAFAERRYLLTFLGLGGLGVVVSTLAARARSGRRWPRSASRRPARCSRSAAPWPTPAASTPSPPPAPPTSTSSWASTSWCAWSTAPTCGWRRTWGPWTTTRRRRHRPLGGRPPAPPPAPAPSTLPLRPEPGTCPLAHRGSVPRRPRRARRRRGLSTTPTAQHLLETLTDQMQPGPWPANALAARLDLIAVRRRSTRSARARACLSSVSHDLRTPLAAITGAATTLQSELGDRVAIEVRRVACCREIVAEGWRFERLVNNLLQMSHVDEAGALSPRLEWEVAQEVTSVAVGAGAPR
jgi:two-component system sensor histidine kinase KdpD